MNLNISETTPPELIQELVNTVPGAKVIQTLEIPDKSSLSQILDIANKHGKAIQHRQPAPAVSGKANG